MIDFTTFFSLILSSISTFLMAEPMCYFVGLVILAFVVQLLKSMAHLVW